MNTMLVLTIIAGVILLGAVLAENRVVDGQFAEKGQFPYQVALVRQGKLHCGAVLVHEKFVLTAAHCFFQGDQPLPEKTLHVFFGSERLLVNGQFRQARTVHVHEKFDHTSNKYDLALVELNKPVTFSETVRGVSVENVAFLENQQATFSGWGRSGEQQNTNYKLKYNTLTSLSAADCATALGDAYYEGALCFHNEQQHSGVCFGDYGGPVVHNGTLVGVASYTVGGTCGGDKPDVFVDVSYFYEWVQEKFGGENN
ncbi:serine protease SP24D-like [Sabethes cyaneus]|uniref:serine protease SP24D-like n=1 Tax=Sabethes cyaneus TaxID=53552 RepID=UPI00237E0F5D|nr:serine protease SP24D-like [Sabethes cyaneus]